MPGSSSSYQRFQSNSRVPFVYGTQKYMPPVSQKLRSAEKRGPQIKAKNRVNAKRVFTFKWYNDGKLKRRPLSPFSPPRSLQEN
jgi:hypothetical protein